MNVLVCMMGLPRSGKSTFATQLGFPVVSPDALRLVLGGKRVLDEAGDRQVWKLLPVMVQTLFAAGNTVVVLDATNTTRWERDQWKSDEWETRFFHVKTSEKLCKERAVATNQLDVVEAISRMVENFEPLGEDEERF